VSRFADRLLAETYADEEPVHAFVPETGMDAWIPEALFYRLQALGVAYKLHVLPLLAEDALRFLNHGQAQTFAEELTFVGEVTNDPALHAQVGAVLGVVSHGLARASKTVVAFDWP